MLSVGTVEIWRVEELMLSEPTTLFAQWRPQIADEEQWLMPNYSDPKLNGFITSIHSWLLKTGRHTILIDTGAGNGKNRPASPRFGNLTRPYLDRLRNVGVTPADVDYVINTHLHVDHIGWNTSWDGERWLPTFPNAKYLMPGREVEARDPKRGAADKAPAVHQPFIDSVQPVLDAGLATLLNGDEKLNDEIEFMPIPGHAPGQMGIRLRSAGEQALFIGDVMHQPIQVVYPDWNSKYCEIPRSPAARGMTSLPIVPRTTLCCCQSISVRRTAVESYVAEIATAFRLRLPCHKAA